MSQSTTHTETQTIAASDVRQGWKQADEEMSLLCERMSQAVMDFDMDQAAAHLAQFALFDIIAAACLQFYLDNELVREYRYDILDGPEKAWGPGPEEVSIGPLPPGARVRLVVYDNPNTPLAQRERWYKRLGWTRADALNEADGVTDETYGTFTSGGYSVGRRVRVSPRFNNLQPAGAAPGREP